MYKEQIGIISPATEQDAFKQDGCIFNSFLVSNIYGLKKELAGLSWQNALWALVGVGALEGGVVLVGEGEGEGRFDKFVCMESFSGKDSF